MSLTPWNLAFEQLIEKEPATVPKKTREQRTSEKRTSLTVKQLVRKVEDSPMSPHHAARIRIALAGREYNYLMTHQRLEELIRTADVDGAELRKALGLPMYPW